MQAVALSSVSRPSGVASGFLARSDLIRRPTSAAIRETSHHHDEHVHPMPLPANAARVTLPVRLRDALVDVFGVDAATIDRVRVVEQSRFARLHGRRIAATTRRDTIYVAGSARRFFADPELVLHEYFHVIAQWNTGALTTWRYLRESLRRGYRNNRFEVEARAFTRRHVLAFAASLNAPREVIVVDASGADRAIA